MLRHNLGHQSLFVGVMFAVKLLVNEQTATLTLPFSHYLTANHNLNQTVLMVRVLTMLTISKILQNKNNR